MILVQGALRPLRPAQTAAGATPRSIFDRGARFTVSFF